MEFSIEIINGDVMVLETPKEDFKIVINMGTGEVIHVEFLELNIQKFDKYVGHARSCYLKYLNKKVIKDLMEGE